MNEERLIEFTDPAAKRPELEIILRGCATDAERKAVHEAFHTFAQGDPNGFSVQFAVLLQAHAKALKIFPDRLIKVLSAEFTQTSDVIASHRAAMKESQATISKNVAEICDQVSSVSNVNMELRDLVKQGRESDVEARETLLARVGRETAVINDAAKLILSISEKRIGMAVAAAYVFGIGSYPIFAALISWLGKAL